MSAPRIFLIGFPKCGLHMLEQAVSVFASPTAKDCWYGHNAWGLTKPEPPLKEVMASMCSLTPGKYAKGHPPYTVGLASAFRGLDMAVYFIYRDLRDVVVSLLHHLRKASPADSVLKHPHPDLYRALRCDEAILLAIIEGVGEFPAFFDWWATYALWLHRPAVCTLRYEDLHSARFRTCARIVDHYCTVGDLKAPMKPVVQAMVRRTRDTKHSATFRKGGSGGWRAAFTPRVIDSFKAHDPGWLVDLGYVQDDDWS